MADRTIAGIVRKFARETPDNIAIKFGDRRMTWRELDERSTRVAAGLQAAGVAPQQRVAFLAKNCLEYFEVSFGAAKLNAVVVAINWRLTPAEIAYTINDAGATVVIVGPDFFQTVAELRSQLTSARQIVGIGRHAGLARLRKLARHEVGARPQRSGARPGHLRAALHQRHDRPAQGRADHQCQPLRPARQGAGCVAHRSQLDQSGLHAALPHRRLRMGARGHGGGRDFHPRARFRSRANARPDAGRGRDECAVRSCHAGLPGARARRRGRAGSRGCAPSSTAPRPSPTRRCWPPCASSSASSCSSTA